MKVSRILVDVIGVPCAAKRRFLEHARGNLFQGRLTLFLEYPYWVFQNTYQGLRLQLSDDFDASFSAPGTVVREWEALCGND